MLAQSRPQSAVAARRYSRSPRAILVAVWIGFSSVFANAAAHAQRAQTDRPAAPPPITRTAPTSGALVGTLGPAATRALQSQSKPSQGSAPTDARRRNNQLFGDGYIPIVVSDAPVYSRGGSTLMVETVSPQVVNGNIWYPTVQPPTWRVVPDEHPVQAWRTVDVDDVVCNASGTCIEQTTRVIARWAPALRAYAFADRLGRVWLVE